MAELKNSQQYGPDKYAIYQVKKGNSYTDLQSCPYARLIQNHRKAYIGNYDQSFVGDMGAKDTPIKILERLTRHLPDGFEGRALEVGDVLAVKQAGVQSAYYVENMGGILVLIALPSFFTRGEDENKTISRGVEEHQQDTVTEHAVNKENVKDVPDPEPRVIDGKTSVLDTLKIKKEKVKQYKPPEKRDDKNKDKEMGMDI